MGNEEAGADVPWKILHYCYLRLRKQNYKISNFGDSSFD
jgi:hypothetical protein